MNATKKEWMLSRKKACIKSTEKTKVDKHVMYHLVPYHGTAVQLSILLSSGSDIFYATTETNSRLISGIGVGGQTILLSTHSGIAVSNTAHKTWVIALHIMVENCDL